MKLYMNQKILSLKDKFYIKDDQEQDRYYVEGELLSIGKKYHIFDMNNTEVAYVHQKVLSLTPKYIICKEGKEIGQIVKKFSILKPKYAVDGLGWTVEGDIMEYDYTIYDHGKEIVQCSTTWFDYGDCYELDVADEADPIAAIAVVLAIDASIDAQEEASAAD